FSRGDSQDPGRQCPARIASRRNSCEELEIRTVFTGTLSRRDRSLMQPLVILNTVGVTSRLLPLAPRLHALAQSQWSRPLREVLPAVTCTAQASMLSGKLPQTHGIVGNGWLYRDTMEVRFWQQSNRLIQSEPVYAALKKRGIR